MTVPLLIIDELGMRTTAPSVTDARLEVIMHPRAPDAHFHWSVEGLEQALRILQSGAARWTWVFHVLASWEWLIATQCGPFAFVNLDWHFFLII